MAGAVEPGAVMRDTVVTHQTDYRATRPKVERKLGHLLRRRHGGRCARVRGKRKVDADFNLLAAVHCPQPRAPRCARAALDNVRMGRGQRMRTRSRHLRRRRSPPKPLREQQRPVRRRGRAPAGQPVVGHSSRPAHRPGHDAHGPASSARHASSTSVTVDRSMRHLSATSRCEPLPDITSTNT